MSSTETPLAPSEYWRRIRRRFTSRYLGFREEGAVAPPGGRAPATGLSLVGPWAGRLWDVQFLEPRILSPDMQVGVSTAVRLVEPADMPTHTIPWLYVGVRPGVFTRGSAGTDRILERYRRRRENAKGALTGDAELDRRWAVYASEEDLAFVFRDRTVQQFLRSAAKISPNPTRDYPTVAVYGTEAALTLPTGSSPDQVGAVAGAFEGFAHVLDRLEEVRGLEPASRTPLAMDLVRDEAGAPFPLARFPCPLCHESTHPRFEGKLDTEVCERCRKGLYRWP